MGKQVSTVILLYVLSFLGYSVQYMLLTNLNIAITNMVYKPLQKSSSQNTTLSLEEEKFHWDELQQGVILGAVFWLLWLSHPVGGILAQNFGAKRVIGFSILIGSIVNLFLPMAAAFHYKILAILRMVQGFVVGLSFPSIFVIVPYWIPPHSRGKFLTCFLGISFGSAVTYFISGFIMSVYGWKAVFYFTAILGLTWCIAWKFLMYDRPDLHPRMSTEEREYIKSTTQVAEVSKGAKIPVPWRRIFLSIIVHSNIVCQFGIMWTIFVITIYAPRYLSFFHNLSSENTGLLSSFPHIFRVLISLVFAIYSDYLIERKVLSITAVRKLATFISHILTGVMMIGLAYFGNILPIAELLIFAILGFSGTATTGAVVGFADISPNFGGILQGLCGVCSHTTGFLIPTLVGYLTFNKGISYGVTDDNKGLSIMIALISILHMSDSYTVQIIFQDTVEQWQKVFLISAAISIFTGLQFIFIWDSRVQKWNYFEDKIKEDKITLTELQ